MLGSSVILDPALIIATSFTIHSPFIPLIMARTKKTAKKGRGEAEEEKKKDVVEKKAIDGKEAAKKAKKATGKKQATEASPEKKKQKRSTSTAHKDKDEATKKAESSKHLQRPRTPSPEAYASSDDGSSTDEADVDDGDFADGEPGVTPEVVVEHSDAPEPPIKSGRGRKRWRKLTNEEEEILIEFYRTHNIFYDKSHDEFLNTNKKTQIRNEKAAKMGLQGTAATIIYSSGFS